MINGSQVKIDPLAYQLLELQMYCDVLQPIIYSYRHTATLYNTPTLIAPASVDIVRIHWSPMWSNWLLM
jgi:hypothetical protein